MPRSGFRIGSSRLPSREISAHASLKQSRSTAHEGRRHCWEATQVRKELRFLLPRTYPARLAEATSRNAIAASAFPERPPSAYLSHGWQIRTSLGALSVATVLVETGARRARAAFWAISTRTGAIGSRCCKDSESESGIRGEERGRGQTREEARFFKVRCTKRRRGRGCAADAQQSQISDCVECAIQVRSQVSSANSRPTSI